jgi:type IV pilus assembly protein PilW
MTAHTLFVESNKSPRTVNGFSLIELMVAMALSLILLAGVLAIFASSRTTYETTDRLSRIQESGRFALDTIVRDLRSAGYMGCSRRADFTNALNTPNPVMWNFALAVEGFDAQGSGWLPTLATGSGAPAEGAVAGSDVLVVRVPRGEFEPIRATSTMADTTSNITVAHVAPGLLETGDVVQISDCNARAIFQITAYNAGDIAHAAGAGAPGNVTDDIGYAFTDMAELVPVQSVLYFLRAGSTPGGGTSLWRRVSDGGIAEELVDGVENMQIQFGEEVAPNNISYRDANDVADMSAVRTVRIALLIRSMSAYGTDVGPPSYDLLGETVENPGDRHMRQIFTTTVNIRNAGT